MTEPSPMEIQFTKAQEPSQEAQKKKKSSKKKPEPQAPIPRREIIEKVIPDLHPEGDFDLMHHTYKLEQQLSTVKRQLKQQKQKFRQVIHGLAKYFDEKGVSSHSIDEYIVNLGTQIAENQDRESDYEKFFTVHKYHIIEDPSTFAAKSLAKVGQTAENGPKNTPMSHSVKLDTTDPNQAPIDLSVSAPIDAPTKRKPGRPPKSQTANNGTEEAPKKRKYTKHKQSEDGATGGGLDIQEIPPLEFSKKSENKLKKAEDAIRGYEEINQKPIDLGMVGQSNFGIEDGLKAAVKMGIDPSALMNPYMAGAFGVQQEGDRYNKLFQEMMKGGAPNPMLNTDKARQELFNYYQGNFK